jgi:colanic acid biosynthesis protein WcaH
MHLNKEDFLRVIEATPFVSIDLVVRNEMGQVLLGYRQNRPAQNYWFVPGGRILKNERTQDALQRIARAELNIEAPPGKLLGVFDHFYENNFYGVPGISTHYVVCAYQFHVKGNTQFVRDAQHAEIKWWDMDSLLASKEVHPNSKLYFQDGRDNGLR